MGENILILLTGGNPLPNYVTADYLLRKGRDDEDILPIPDCILLVHSTDTEYLAEKIKEKIESKYNSVKFEMIDIKKSERNGNDIKTKISDKLKFLKDNPGIESVHLNYTGGTKPMAAFGCMAVDEFCRKNGINIILSDLDPDKFQISVAKTGHLYPVTGKLLDKIHLGIKDIFELHCMEIKKEGTDSLTFPDELLNLNDFVSEAVPKFDVKNRHTGWFEKVRKEIGEKNNTWNELKSYNFSGFEGKYDSIISEFPSLRNFFENNRFKESLGKKKGEDFVRFFTGTWLEDFILLTLINLKNDGKIEFNDIKKGAVALNNGVKTEIDVIAMKGYQMFLFTCTTSQKISLVKEKAFEGIFRAEQLGGEHAQVISVSMLPYVSQNKECNMEKLKNNLSEFRASKKSHCIGYEEIFGEINGEKTLSKRIKEIF